MRIFTVAVDLFESTFTWEFERSKKIPLVNREIIGCNYRRLLARREETAKVFRSWEPAVIVALGRDRRTHRLTALNCEDGDGYLGILASIEQLSIDLLLSTYDNDPSSYMHGPLDNLS